MAIVSLVSRRKSRIRQTLDISLLKNKNKRGKNPKSLNLAFHMDFNDDLTDTLFGKVIKYSSGRVLLGISLKPTAFLCVILIQVYFLCHIELYPLKVSVMG